MLILCVSSASFKASAGESKPLQSASFEQKLLELNSELSNIDRIISGFGALRITSTVSDRPANSDDEIAAIKSLLASGAHFEVIRRSEQVINDIGTYSSSQKLQAALMCAESDKAVAPSQVINRLTFAFQLATTTSGDLVSAHDALSKMYDWLTKTSQRPQEVRKLLTSFGNIQSDPEKVAPLMLVGAKIADFMGDEQIAYDLFQQAIRLTSAESVRAEATIHYARHAMAQQKQKDALDAVLKTLSLMKDQTSQSWQILRLFEARLRISTGDNLGAEPILTALADTDFLGQAALEDLIFLNYRLNRFEKTLELAKKWSEPTKRGKTFATNVPGMRALFHILAGDQDSARKVLNEESKNISSTRTLIQELVKNPGTDGAHRLSKIAEQSHGLISLPELLKTLVSVNDSLKLIDDTIIRQKGDVALLQMLVAADTPSAAYSLESQHGAFLQQQAILVLDIGKDLAIGSAAMATISKQEQKAAITELSAKFMESDTDRNDFRESILGYRNWINLGLIQNRLEQISRENSFRLTDIEKKSLRDTYSDLYRLKHLTVPERSPNYKMLASMVRKGNAILDFKSKVEHMSSTTSIGQNYNYSARDLDYTWNHWEGVIKRIYEQTQLSQLRLERSVNNIQSQIDNATTKLIAFDKDMASLRHQYDQITRESLEKLAVPMLAQLDERQARLSRWSGDAAGLNVKDLQANFQSKPTAIPDDRLMSARSAH